MLGDTHFAMGGFKALPRVTPRLTPQGWAPQPRGSNPMSCEVTCPKSPGMASEDRGPQHLWWWWGVSSCASAPPIHPPICCQIPATLGRAADNPWQGLARHQGGRRKEQPPTAASGSRALTRPHSWHCRHRSPGPCVQGLSVPSRQTPTQAWLLLVGGGCCSHMGGRTWPYPGLQVTFHRGQRAGVPGCVEIQGGHCSKHVCFFTGPSLAPGSFKGGNKSWKMLCLPHLH